VIDGGPGCSVEDSAHKQIVDASYSTCKHFTGSTSCGWSDKIVVTCKKTSYTAEDLIPGSYEGQSKAEGYGIVTDASRHESAVASKDQAYRGKIPIGPCSYNGTYAAEHNRPICGYDFDLNFNENTNQHRVTTEQEQAPPRTVGAVAPSFEHINATLGYNGGSAVNWGNAYCGRDSEWLCAEFVARALHEVTLLPILQPRTQNSLISVCFVLFSPALD
jgi:hypothetical protein